MTYPRIEVDLAKIEYNTEQMVNLCSRVGVSIVGITKVFSGLPEIARAMVAGGVSLLGDSRLENLARLQDIDVEKMLIRIPMASRADEVVKYADISLNSELRTVKELAKQARYQGKEHKVILMYDVGDLREGYFDANELIKTAGAVLNLEGIQLAGIGTNIACYGGVMPSKKNLTELLKLADQIEDKYRIKLGIISGGNSSVISLIERGELPAGINQLRLGASLILGIGLNDQPIKGLYYDAFKLKAEIIEIKEKPSIPVGELGLDAFGNNPVFVDRGTRKKAVCALGKQDLNFSDISLTDNDIIILGGSSDHLILDISESQHNYQVGDIMTFNLNYAGLLRAMTSRYIKKLTSYNTLLKKERPVCL